MMHGGLNEILVNLLTDAPGAVIQAEDHHVMWAVMTKKKKNPRCKNNEHPHLP